MPGEKAKQSFETDSITFGYILVKHEFDKDKNYGIVLNPPKDELIEFRDHDLVIVFAHE